VTNLYRCSNCGQASFYAATNAGGLCRECVTLRGKLRRVVLGLALAVIAVISSNMCSTPADAADPLADTRPCVANREANSLTSSVGRSVLEARWEVRGRGEPLEVGGVGLVVTYPWCDHGGRDRAWIGVIYGAKRQALTEVWWKADREADDTAAPVDPTPCPGCQIIGKASLPVESAVAR